MLPDRVSNPGPRTYESGAQPIALRGPAHTKGKVKTDEQSGPRVIKVFSCSTQQSMKF